MITIRLAEPDPVIAERVARAWTVLADGFFAAAGSHGGTGLGRKDDEEQDQGISEDP